MDKVFARGIYFNEKHQNSPEFVLGSITIHKNLLTEWLKEQTVDEKGYIKLDIKKSREGKIYTEVNTWKSGATSKDFQEAFPGSTPLSN